MVLITISLMLGLLCVTLDNMGRCFSLHIDNDEVVFNNVLPDYRRSDPSYPR